MGYTGKLIQITTVANELRIPMYLIIDEFDNFTNQTYKRLKKEKIYKDYLLLSQIILILHRFLINDSLIIVIWLMYEKKKYLCVHHIDVYDLYKELWSGK